MYDTITLSLIILLVLCWTLNPFLKKKTLKGLDPNASLLMNHCLVTGILIIYFIIMFYNKKCSLKELRNINKTQFIYSIIAATITFLSSLVLINLLKRANVSYIMPHIQPLVLLLTILIGFFIFKENVTKLQFIGGIVTIIGLWLLNKKK